MCAAWAPLLPDMHVPCLGALVAYPAGAQAVAPAGAAADDVYGYDDVFVSVSGLLAAARHWQLAPAACTRKLTPACPRPAVSRLHAARERRELPVAQALCHHWQDQLPRHCHLAGDFTAALACAVV